MYVLSLFTGAALAVSGIIYQIATVPGFGRHSIPSAWAVLTLAVTPFLTPVEAVILMIAGMWPMLGWLNHSTVGHDE